MLGFGIDEHGRLIRRVSVLEFGIPEHGGVADRSGNLRDEVGGDLDESVMHEILDRGRGGGWYG